MSLKTEIKDAMKAAMRSGDKPRLGAIRLIQADIKRIEVDERIEVDDARVLVILDRMLKQRRDSISQYEGASRQDLADIEIAEVAVIQDFLPEALTEEELAAMIDAAIASTGASSMKDMGQVMAIIKPQAQGRTDIGKLSQSIKAKLS
ncbi:MAG: GatB/YqeY domain-containing protein [Pseudomonadales bacterium]